MGKLTRRSFLQRLDHAFMLKVFEGILHAPSKGEAEVMLTHTLVVNRRVVFLTEPKTIILEIVYAFYNEVE